MCGKFTTIYAWHDAVFLEQLSEIESARNENENREITLRVMGGLPVIVFDKETGARRVIAMRWGFPHPTDWRRPQPIHARAETIETTRAFAGAFLGGQRGIVLMKSFNEAPDMDGPPLQHRITPDDGQVLAAAFVWRRFDIGTAVPMLACCLVTVPGNALLAGLPTDRMPAFLAPEDWETWLGEKPAPVDDIKACLKTMEGARWSMTREARETKTRRGKPTVSDPGGLF